MYFLTTKSKMIPHTKTKQSQHDQATPTIAIFQSLSVACKTKFGFFSKSYCDFLVLCSPPTPCDLAIPSLLPFPKPIMSFIL